MIGGSQFVESVEKYFSFLISEYRYKIIERITNGNFYYRVRYLTSDSAITISYENIENYLSIYISKLSGGQIPDYDDKNRTIHLDEVIPGVLSTLTKSDFEKNDVYFSKFASIPDDERNIFKAARELRLALKHLSLKRDI